MLRSSLLIALSVVAFACAKDKAKDTGTTTTPPAGSGSAMAGSGSAMAGSDTGSAAGSGSAMAGSDAGSAAGSGSAMAGSGSDAGEESAFDKLTHDEKVKLMKTKVMPAMKAAFQKFDRKEYANFGCKTCHGKDPQKSKYEMPTPDLPVLDFDKIKAGKVDPKVLEFMSKVVKPEMAKILGEPEMTETQKGFGCLNCHTAKK
jgi:hypothetical protein